MKETLCCLVFIDGCTGIRANTLDSMEHPGEHEPPPLDTPESPPIPKEQRMQRAAAAVGKNLSPNNTVTEDILYHQRCPEHFYVVPDRDLASGIG